jgi:hypothetical protein
MMETRKIIGVIDELPAKKDVSFPSVRVWIDSPNGCETRGLSRNNAVGLAPPFVD